MRLGHEGHVLVFRTYVQSHKVKHRPQDPLALPSPKYGDSHIPFKTVRDAISHFPAIAAGSAHPLIKNHVAASITSINLNRLKNTPINGGDRRSWPPNLYLECHKKDYNGHTDVYGRMYWDRPAPALTARCHSISNGRYGHPCQDRAISLREAAALQSFPDRYTFFGSNKHVAMQIGNAVPIILAEALGRQIVLVSQKLLNL
jgi:DNA (cytosine-5)-methyltransferase 1